MLDVRLLIDIRPAKAFEQGHIPGAISLPFPDVSQAELMPQEMDKTLRQLNDYSLRVKNLVSTGRFSIYCENGVFTSVNCATFLNTKGLFPAILEGGYKAFRQNRKQFFQREFQLVVLRGLTGSGKTKLLSALEKQGKQCLHLEALAKHRGSAFGAYPHENQTTNEQFANAIFQALHPMDISQPIFVEYKGAFIGRVQIPVSFYKKIQQPNQTYYLEVPRAQRIQNILLEYQSLPTPTLLQAIQKLEGRLAKPDFEKCQQLAQKRNLMPLVDLLLNYYDQGQEYQMPPGAKVLRPPFLV